MTSRGLQTGAQLGDAFARAVPELAVPWRAVRPEAPELLALNEPLARELGLDPLWLRDAAGVRFLLGNELPEGAAPVAQAYAGHQFGAYAPRLGDGRALLLGELVDAGGRRRDLHLKGSGRTPFARGADGFAAVGPMLREYLMGEAMHALGIPTTRALAVVATGQRVLRDDALDALPGAVLVRTASSHLRVGSFQFARSLGEIDVLRRLADHAIERHFPELAQSESPYLGLLEAVIAAQARLVAAWMLVGFVHGVINTDNTTISGETIDYGPCAFVDAYDPAAVFSSIDHRGRYAYGNQPGVVLWNLTRFAESLLPLLASRGPGEPGAGESGSGPVDPEPAKQLALGALDRFAEIYSAAWSDGMRAKLGIAGTADARRPVGDETLARVTSGLLQELHDHGIDYTSAFRALGAAARGDEAPYRALVGGEPGAWFAEWRTLDPDASAMDAANPRYIPRNHLVDEALEAATAGDLGPFARMLDAVTRPFEARPGFERYEQPAPPGSSRHVTFCGT
ncbi:protein adenylyltransferase SelO [Leucobacter triazinivorans]|uniref:Protein nucleotidyltransferase YdiU n=1 Tax=Leucobacter triazinivorans TaxID=1784719 RepID=A0A4P6KFF0_9MICO|nr:YdiU family protein [Leucobacter triazinivorans]QBE48164.1 YdiU family protein [Leucobacter triazinivorans]